PAREQARAERLLKVADARRCGCKRKMRALGAARDASRLDHVAEEIEIDQIEMHGIPFVDGERTLHEIRIAYRFGQSKFRLQRRLPRNRPRCESDGVKPSAALRRTRTSPGLRCGPCGLSLRLGRAELREWRTRNGRNQSAGRAAAVAASGNLSSQPDHGD